MEIKTKHRIIGLLVLISLGLLIFPFFQGTSNIPKENKLMNAPPFPDQPSLAALPEEKPSSSATQAQSDEASQHPNDIISTVRPTVINEPLPLVQTPDVLAPLTEDRQETVAGTPALSPAVSEPTEIPAELKIKKASPKKRAKVQFATKHPVGKVMPLKEKGGDKGLISLKQSAWIIQMGSFKNKANALRLVNQLRAKGYSAFIQQTSSAFGGSTRVFVGPETKHADARELASQLETELHLKGIILSYKPLSL